VTNIYAPRCACGDDGSCSLYNSKHTNYIEIHTQRIVDLQVRALFAQLSNLQRFSYL